MGQRLARVHHCAMVATFHPSHSVLHPHVCYVETEELGGPFWTPSPRTRPVLSRLRQWDSSDCRSSRIQESVEHGEVLIALGGLSLLLYHSYTSNLSIHHTYQSLRGTTMLHVSWSKQEGGTGRLLKHIFGKQPTAGSVVERTISRDSPSLMLMCGQQSCCSSSRQHVRTPGG